MEHYAFLFVSNWETDIKVDGGNGYIENLGMEADIWLEAITQSRV